MLEDSIAFELKAKEHNTNGKDRIINLSLKGNHACIKGNDTNSMNNGYTIVNLDSLILTC